MRFLFSTPNIAGSLVALLVIGAYFIGWVDRFWWLLAIGGYLAGALFFALRMPPPLLHLPDGQNTQQALDWLKRSVLPKMPVKARQVLADIIERVEALMPRLKEMESQGLVDANNRNLLKQTVTRYLPDAVEGYLRLPQALTKKATVATMGKSPEDLLTEQLILLRDHVKTLEENIFSNDVNALLANGRFLQEKFQKSIDFERE
ncbi:MAG: hypothetical protein JNM52_08450 [Betaproteobacteria bacterium]|nr:hypothetical protein [Betaproteobacteria bacterium]